MAEKGPWNLRKLVPPLGTPESPIWEFGYDCEVKVVNGLCVVESEPMRDRLLKRGYELTQASVPVKEPEPEDKEKREKGWLKSRAKKKGKPGTGK